MKTARALPRNLLCCLLAIAAVSEAEAKRREPKESEALAKYLARVGQAKPPASELSPGSLWIDAGNMAALSSDYKARSVGDTIEIVVVQGLTSSNANSVNTARTLSTNSGITSLPGKLKTGGVSSLLALNSSEALAGKGSASTATSVTTNLAGRVVAVLASGNLVVEARRTINMNNEKQTISLRGVVRRGDIGPNNTVASDSVGDLELEIKGKGVISDSVRQPNIVVRTLMRLLDF